MAEYRVILDVEFLRVTILKLLLELLEWSHDGTLLLLLPALPTGSILLLITISPIEIPPGIPILPLPLPHNILPLNRLINQPILNLRQLRDKHLQTPIVDNPTVNQVIGHPRQHTLVNKHQHVDTALPDVQ
jgi:hypothetical protein